MNTQKSFLKNISNEIKRHKNLYKLAEIKSVIARRADVPSKEGEWYNFLTLIKLLHSGSPTSWQKKVEKDDFVILSAIITIDRFKAILGRLVKEQVLEVDGYQAFGPFNFAYKHGEFLGSEQSNRLYNIDWAVNVWHVVGKENLGLPNNISLELESETIPFEHARDAIRYHADLTHEGYDKMRNSIHIVAPLYYARIKKIDLSGRELLVEIDCSLVNPQDLKIAYNTEGPNERAHHYEVFEANTVQPDENTTTINLKYDAEMATVWLQYRGLKIDSRGTRRTPTIETIEKQLTSESPYLYEETAGAITETINLRSKEGIPALTTTEQGVDSIDVEILNAVKTLGGDYSKCIPEVLKYLSFGMLLSRLARLRTLGFIELQPPRKILLTSLGVDAINLPPSVLPARVPSEIGERIAEIRLAFQNEDWDEVTNKSTKLLETILRKRLEEKFSGTLSDVWPNLSMGPYDRASLGTLKGACVKLKVFRRDGVADHILSIILKLRVPISHEKKGKTSPSNIASLTVKLVEAFVRAWYYL